MSSPRLRREHITAAHSGRSQTRLRLSRFARDETPRRFKALAFNITTYPVLRIRPYHAQFGVTPPSSGFAEGYAGHFHRPFDKLRTGQKEKEYVMQKDEPPSVLGEALLDAVIARRPRDDYRPRRPLQLANTFINRSGELASAAVAPLAPPDKGGEGAPHPPRESRKQIEAGAANEHSRYCG